MTHHRLHHRPGFSLNTDWCPSQVARKLEGQATTFRAVAAEVLREGGWVGMFRAAGPKMASSALWGTAMVSVYEGLKRVSVKE